MRLNLVGLARAADLEEGDVAFVQTPTSWARWARIASIDVAPGEGRYRVLFFVHPTSGEPLHPGSVIVRNDDLVLVRSEAEIAHVRPRPPQEGT